MISFLPRLGLLAATLAAAPQLAFAHAVLVASTPAPNAVVHSADMHVALRFNSRLDGPRCTLALVPPSGKATPLALAPQPAPDSIAAEATELHNGSYVLRWQALASDGHITRGEVPFRVQLNSGKE